MLRIIAATDKGLVRDLNEDRFAGEIFDPDCAYALVCDGMGGENAGSVASGIACEEIRRLMESSLRRGMDEKSLYHLLEIAVSTANAMVYDKASQDPENMGGMGTTACLAVISGETAYIANVGDSRAYLIDHDGAMQITRDHSFVQYLVDIGKLTPEEARKSSKKNIITRAVGVDREVSVDVSVIEKKQYADKTLLLCSDGLSNYIDAPALAPLRREHPDCADFVKTLIDEANRAGGSDNITAVAVRLD